MSIAFRIREILVRMVSEPLAVMLSTVTGWLSLFCWNGTLWSQVMNRT